MNTDSLKAVSQRLETILFWELNGPFRIVELGTTVFVYAGTDSSEILLGQARGTLDLMSTPKDKLDQEIMPVRVWALLEAISQAQLMRERERQKQDNLVSICQSFIQANRAALAELTKEGP